MEQISSESVRKLGGQSIIVALAALGIVCLFLLPVPRELLDILLALNISLSLVILLRGLLIAEPIQLFAFPTILLLTTLFRLGLNVSSTRLILLKGDQGLDSAGQVIRAFGEFVVQGDFVVGAIVFGVIALVNFVVITKGAARVAEVSARFSLDSLPGKQLAIDADLRTGNINREEAERRRSLLMHESNFYGSMDGAMRFIQGDAIASLSIVAIVVVGGAIIGVNRGMEVEEALRRFGVLAIGDGLVSILPALLISVCAGVVVTAVSRSRHGTVSRQVLQTVMSDQLALFLAGIGSLLIAFIPGFPALPFLLIGVFLLLVSYQPRVRSLFQRFSLPEPLLRIVEGIPTSQPLESQPALLLNYEPESDVVLIEIQNDEATADIRKLEWYFEEERERVLRRRGLELLPLRVRYSGQSERVGIVHYRVFFRGRLVQEANILRRGRFVRCAPTQILSFAPELRALGQDPILGCPGVWIQPNERVERGLAKLGIESLDPLRFLALEAVGVQLKCLDELFGVDELKKLISRAGEQHPRLVEEFQGREFLSSIELCSIFRSLIRSRMSIRDVKLLLDGILEFAATEPLPPPHEASDRLAWIEQVVQALRKKCRMLLVEELSDMNGELQVFRLGEELETQFEKSLRNWTDRTVAPVLPREVENSVRRAISRLFAPVLERGRLPLVVLCEPEIRSAVDEFLREHRFAFAENRERQLGGEWYRTIGSDELTGIARIESLGVLQLN